MLLTDSVKYIKGVGEVRLALLNKLGVTTLGELITYYPRAYEDWSNISDIFTLQPGDSVCIKGKLIVPPVMHRTKSGCLVKTIASDSTGIINIIFFNNKYIQNQLREGETYLFYGKISADAYMNREMLSPKFTALSSDNQPLLPVYRQTAGLNSLSIQKIMKNALLSAKGAVTDPLPEYLIKKHDLMPLYDAVCQMHFPSDTDNFRRAKSRLIFEELLYLQLGMGLLRTGRHLYTAVRITDDYTADFCAGLPFELTGAQRRCIDDCMRDMRSDKPMNRLIQGDVGSGKTAVAAALIYSAVRNGWQCAFMAPTEVLAKQHAESMRALLGEGFNIGLLTGAVSKKEKDRIKSDLLSGRTDLLIGTHAIIQDSVQFSRLGLVITDEQHRFGVKQRAKLTGKGRNPHTLIMSATPIPRTLALIVYGDLDVSVIDELPRGRQPIETYCVTTAYHQRIYKFIRKHVAEGRQAYVVCPAIDENEDDSPVTAAAEYYQTLKNDIFPDLTVGLLHGRMKNAEKNAVMAAFSSGDIDILVSTVVIEVGVDVPNAALMVIENADRFGLSQLHQLRGRIGRGQYKSTCILVSDSHSEETKQRLNVICKTNDGFKIADEDLKQRGPGDFLGERQHGLPELKVASLSDDTRLLFKAREQAESILLADPELTLPEHRQIRKKINELFNSVYSA